MPEPTPWPRAMPAACPACRSALAVEDILARCPSCDATYAHEAGIWRMLTPEAEERLSGFMADYRGVREAEGRGGEDDAWFRSLPDPPPGDPFRHEWRIRAASFRTFVAKILEPAEDRAGSAMNILDLGSGNGWLANRLAERGHRVVGVDLSDDPRDGLGTWKHYASRWLPVQAEFDRLPFADGCVDLVIFGASLHYSVDLASTLAEALRVLRPDGRLAIIDSPLYGSADSGRRMLAERAESFQRSYGFRSDSLPVAGFLTEARLRELAEVLRVDWSRTMPWYGLAWALRPWRARVRRRREPARFPILVASRSR